VAQGGTRGYGTVFELVNAAFSVDHAIYDLCGTKLAGEPEPGGEPFFSFTTNFFISKTREGLEAFSGADLSRRSLSRVHRRPLTGSTAGITAFFIGAV
jgi:hypothetical protein